MENKTERFLRLKKKAISGIGDKYDLDLLKEYFKDDIDSPRTLSLIKSLPDLLEVLEERDVLSYQCPMPLFHIGKLLKNDCVMNLINFYRKHLLDEAETNCSCGLKIDYNPSPPLLQIEGNIKNSYLNSSDSANSDVMEAIKNVADRIGKNWRVLISELPVIECQIDLIYKKYPNDSREQAYQALLFWVENEKENATIECLDKALNARLCKIKGIGTHLRIPIPGIS